MTAAPTPHDLWVGVSTRIAGQCGDTGYKDERANALLVAANRVLGLPDLPLRAERFAAAIADPRTAAELGEAYLAEYGRIIDAPVPTEKAPCPSCTAVQSECTAAADRRWRWFICPEHTPHIVWSATR